MPTTQKAATIAELTTLLRDSQLAVVTDYRGLSVAALSQLRRNLRGKAVLHVTKNTLLTRAAQDANVPQLTDLLTGPSAVAFVKDDIAGTIKVLNDFARTSRILTMRGALFGPSLVAGDKVADLANVPTRQQLYAQVVGSVQGPLNNLVGTLNQVYAQVVYALQDYADKKGGGTLAAEASADTTPVAEASADTTPVVEASADTTPVAEAAADAAPAETGADIAPAAEAAAEEAPAAETGTETDAEA
jgi:large subunit ribosomal protein L10